MLVCTLPGGGELGGPEPDWTGPSAWVSGTLTLPASPEDALVVGW
jgi:hypothetical protein